MTTLVLWAIVIGGTMLTIYFARSRWSGWPFVPLAWITALYVHDLGIAGLMRLFYADVYLQRFGGRPLPRAADEEILSAAGLGVLLYLGILLGLIAGQKLGSRWLKMSAPTLNRTTGFDNEWARLITWIYWGLGVAISSVVLHRLGGISQLEAIIVDRLFYSSEEFVGDEFSGYLMVLKEMAPVGALLLLAMARTRSAQRSALLACGLAAASFAMIGSRGRFMLFLASAAIVWNERIGSFRTRRWIAWGMIAFLLFVMLNAVRTQSLQEPFNAAWIELMYSDRLDTIAVIQRVFPNVVPFTNGTGFLAALANLIPGNILPGAETTWTTIVEVLFEGQNPHAGIGGEAFHSAGQLYMNFGLPGVLVGGFLLVVPFGLFFEWCRYQRGSFLASVLYAIVMPRFVMSTGSALLGNSTGVWMYAVMAVIPVALMTVRRLTPSKVLVVDLLAAIQLFILWKGFRVESIKLLIIVSVTAMYVISAWIAVRVRDEWIFSAPRFRKPWPAPEGRRVVQR